MSLVPGEVDRASRITALISKWDYLRRHFHSVLPYLTLLKIANAAVNQLEMRFATLRPRSAPLYIKMEATPLCHLSCGGCVHTDFSHKKSLNNKMHLSVEQLRKVVDPLASKLIGVSFSYSGEPLLNSSLCELVSYVHGRNICTSFSTNLSVPLTDQKADQLVRSGLDRMQISLDGASEETYRRYRKGGNFNLVVENVKKLAEAKRRNHLNRPRLVWKMVVFPYNRFEVREPLIYSLVGVALI